MLFLIRLARKFVRPSADLPSTFDTTRINTSSTHAT